MKVVINRCYGGFGINKDWMKKNGITVHQVYGDTPDEYENFRTNPILISAVENGETIEEDGISSLRVVEIPDEATDWTINDYDGMENVIYVLNGHIYYAQ